MTQKPHKIVLCGHYGATNLGDEAIGLSIVQSLRKQHPQAKIVMLSYDPTRTTAFYNKYAPELNISSVYLLPLGIRSLLRGILKGELWRTLKEIRTCDRFVLGGGGLFTDERLFAVFLWGIHAFFANHYKKTLHMIAQSVGPLKSRVGKWVTRKAFSKASFISVRDEESKKMLKSVGIKNEITVSTDAVFGLKIDGKNDKNMVNQEVDKKCIQEGLNSYFVFSVRPWGNKSEYLYKNIIQAVQQISEKYKLLPVFVPFQLIKENDQQLLNKIIVQNGLGSQIEVRKYTDDIFEILNLISGAKFTLGVRLHSLLFSLRVGVPIIGISYSPKIKNFMKGSDVDLSEYILPMNHEEKMVQNIMNLSDRIISKRETIIPDLLLFSKNKKEIWQKTEINL